MNLHSDIHRTSPRKTNSFVMITSLFISRKHCVSSRKSHFLDETIKNKNETCVIAEWHEIEHTK